MLIEEIEMQLREGKPIEDALEGYDWKKFETFICEIFQQNGFSTKQNFRFKTKKRHEIDVVATRNKLTFCVDCKWWGRGRYKKAGLKVAAVSQQARVKELIKFLKKNIIARSLLKISSDHMIYPLLVTLHEEDTVKENETFVIPAWKLNRFVTEAEDYF